MTSEVHSQERRDLYSTITTKIVAAMEAGAGKFVMPWHRQGVDTARPLNAITGNAYRGVNVLALWASAMGAGYDSGRWASYRQWQMVGAQVQKSERGTMIIFYKRLDEDGAYDENRVEGGDRSFVARASHVFNAEQVTGWEQPAPTRTPVAGLDHVDVFVEATKASVKHGGDISRYRLTADCIDMPPRDAFIGISPTESYYAVLLHELIHWTGAPQRLARDLGERYGKHAYAMEELVAELGAAFLCATLGVTNEPRPEHAAYVKSWLEALKHDRKAIFIASSKAQQAVDYLQRLAVQHLGDELGKIGS